MSQALTTINFHGNNLYLVNYQDEPYTPMRPIVEGMGLDWRSQHRKLTENKERWGVVILTTPTAGERQHAVCMPVRKLPAFFASISVNKVRENLRATIILFQTECDDVLWKYWTGQQVQKQATLDTTSRLSKPSDTERKALHKLVKVWAGLVGGHQGETMPRCNIQVAALFGVTTVDEMTVEQVREAIKWVQGKIDAMPKALPDPVESNVRLSPEAAKGLAARYPHLADVFMKHAGQGLPVPVSASYVNEIKALRDEADQRICDFRIWLREFYTRMERATGPMVKELVCSQLLRGNRDSRGSTIINSDYLISALHVFRWSDRETLDDGLETMRYAMRDYESFARTLDKLRAASF